MVSSIQKEEKEEKKEEAQSVKQYPKCYGSLNAKINCTCSLYYECTIEIIEKIIKGLK